MLAGVILALASESSGLEVEVATNNNNSNNNCLGHKHFDYVRISFSRLGFQPLQLGGLTERDLFSLSSSLSSPHRDVSMTVDEAFTRIDLDNNGFLDQTELATSLRDVLREGAVGHRGRRQIKRSNPEMINNLASELLALYDLDANGRLDKEEYKLMVEDIACIKKEEELKRRLILTEEREFKAKEKEIFCNQSLFKLTRLQRIASWFRRIILRHKVDNIMNNYYVKSSADGDLCSVDFEEEPSAAATATGTATGTATATATATAIGSIELDDFTLDLRQFLLGNLPFFKRFRPGGNLILTPIVINAEGSFTAEDILNSPLLIAGIRRLVARAFRVRVRDVRDLLDGALIFGRQWTQNSENEPSVEIPVFDDIYFDENDNAIICGRFYAKTKPGDPLIENAFRLRTKLGTRQDGQIIGLENPEIALILECPCSWEKNIVMTCKQFKIKAPPKPDPVIVYVPLGERQRFKDADGGGFDLGEDNKISAIWIADGALRFKLRTILRPGKFLDNHFLAFSVPIRRFIITLERVKKAIRSARANKRLKLKVEGEGGEVKLVTNLRVLNPRSGNKEKEEQVGTSAFKKFIKGYQSNNKRESTKVEALGQSLGDWFEKQKLE